MSAAQGPTHYSPVASCGTVGVGTCVGVSNGSGVGVDVAVGNDVAVGCDSLLTVAIGVAVGKFKLSAFTAGTTLSRT